MSPDAPGAVDFGGPEGPPAASGRRPRRSSAAPVPRSEIGGARIGFGPRGRFGATRGRPNSFRVRSGSRPILTGLLWTLLILSLGAAALAGALLLFSLIFLVLVETTQVTQDPLGLSVDIPALPGPLARRLGAGRLAWKRISALERRGFFFVLKGNAGGPPEPGELLDRDLRFLVVDQLERLVLMILEQSPNIRVEE